MKIIFAMIMLIPFFGKAQKTLDELIQHYNTRSVPYISVEELRMLQMEQKLNILDAREKNEFNVSHLKGASFVGFETFNPEEIFQTIKNKDEPIIIYCSLGIRSEQIGEKFTKAGYTNVKNLYGGIFEWKNKGYPVYDSSNLQTEKVHAFSKPWGKWLKKGIKIYE